MPITNVEVRMRDSLRLSFCQVVLFISGALSASQLLAQSPGCATPPAGLVSWWPGENNAADLIGGNAGAVQPQVFFTDGEVDRCFDFIGNSLSYVEVPDSPALRLTNAVTIEFWVKRQRLTYPSFPYADYVVEKGGDFTGGQTDYSAALHNASYNYCLHFVFAGGWRGAGSIAETNLWHHCAIVARQGDANPAFYIDGVNQTVTYSEGAATINLYPSTKPLHIGAMVDPATGWFYYSDLLVDELAIYNRALSASEIQAIYAAGSAGKCPVELPPLIYSPPMDQTVNGGTTVVFNVGVLGTQPLHYQWFFNSQSIGLFGDGASLVLSNVQPSQAGDYFVLITNSFGSATSAVVHLTVLTNPPSITTQPQDQTVDAGASAYFSVGVQGSPPFIYQWFFDNSALAGATQWSLLFTNVQPNQAGSYSVLVSNQWGAVMSSNALLTVLTFPPSIRTQPRGTNAYVGATVGLTALAAGTPPLNYQWQKDGAPIPGATLNYYRILNVQLTNAGVYSVTITNPYGSITSSNAVVTVSVPPPCAPPPPGLVSWWRGEGNVLDAWDSNNGFTQTPLTVRYAPGKVGQAFAYSSFFVPDSLSLHLANFTLQAWVYNTNYSGTGSHTIFSKSSYLNVGYPPLYYRSMSYYLGTTNNGLVYFAVSGNGSNTVSATASAPLAANDWSLVVASYDGAALRIYVNGQLAAQRPYSGGVYQTSDDIGIGGAAASSYLASFLPFNGLLDELCIYSRALSDSEILALYNSDVTGICQEPPVITAQPQSQTIPLGEDVLFSATIVGSRPLQFQWYFNNQPLLRATNATLLLDRVQSNQAGLYSVRVTNSMGFALSGSAQLSTSSKPVCVEPPSGLLSWWPADGSGIDVAGSNNATAQAPAYAPGKVGLAFAITNQLIRPPFGLGITVPNSPSLNFKSNADFTIETWFKTGPAAPLIDPIGRRILPVGTQEVVSKHGLQIFPAGLASDTGYSVLLDSGRLGCWISSGVGRLTNSGTFVTSGPDLRDGMFHHIALSFARNATNGGNLYLDGNHVLTFSTVPFRGDISNTGPLSIGYDGAFSGLIDELAFYSRALGPDEIMSIRQAGAAGKCKERPFIIAQPASQAVPPGNNATFAVLAGGTPNLRYQWRFNNGMLAGATRSSLTISNVQALNVGNYFVTISNGFGSVTSTNARLALNRPPVANCAPAVVAAGPNCMADASINNGSSDPDGDPITLTQTPPGPYPLGTNVVMLTVTDIWGATNSCVSAVIVRDQTPPTIFCPGDITVTNAHNAWTSVVTFSPTVTDNCSAVGPVLCDPPSGSAFPVGTTLVNCVAVDTSGNSNTCSFRVSVLPGNVPPVPIIKVAPWAIFPWLTNGFVIAGNGSNVNVTFDGSKSYDVDDAKFNFAWYLGNLFFSSNRVAHRFLNVGAYTITLRVDDTFPLGTNSTSITVKVISALDALDLLRQKVQAGGLPRSVQQVLLNSLDKAQRDLQRGHLPPAAQAVRQFLDEVRKQVAPLDSGLAGALTQAAQALQNALLGPRAHGPYDGIMPTVTPVGHGHMQVSFADDPSQVYVVEASSDLLNWEEIGTATQADDGTFQFEDPQAGQFGHRYYRIVTP